MRRLLPWISLFLVVSLAACGLLQSQTPAPGPAATPTPSAGQMQTQISQMLTRMPTNAGQAAQGAGNPTATLQVITVDTATPGTSTGQGGNVVTVTSAPSVPTNTSEPQATATTAPQSTNTPVPATAAAAATATTQPSGPTATVSPQDPASFQTSNAVTDDMSSARTWNWPTGFDEFTSADFTNGAQEITTMSHTDGWRMANPIGAPFGSVLIRAQFTVNDCKSTDHYGLMVRVPVLHLPTRGYLFGVNCKGEYSLRRWVWDREEPPQKKMDALIYWTNKTRDGKTANINLLTGQNATNTLEILIKGSNMKLYVNGQYLNEKSDNEIAWTINHKYKRYNGLEGYFGVFVGSPDRADGGFTVKLNEMSYWQNPRTTQP